MNNIGKLEYPAANLVAATALLADFACHTETTCPEVHAQIHWLANRVRDDAKVLFDALLAEIETGKVEAMR